MCYFDVLFRLSGVNFMRIEYDGPVEFLRRCHLILVMSATLGAYNSVAMVSQARSVGETTVSFKQLRVDSVATAV